MQSIFIVGFYLLSGTKVYVAARKAKGKNEWFVGAITDENDRTDLVDGSFLAAGKTYTASLYRDGNNVGWH